MCQVHEKLYQVILLSAEVAALKADEEAQEQHWLLVLDLTRSRPAPHTIRECVWNWVSLTWAICQSSSTAFYCSELKFQRLTSSSCPTLSQTTYYLPPPAIRPLSLYTSYMVLHMRHVYSKCDYFPFYINKHKPTSFNKDFFSFQASSQCLLNMVPACQWFCCGSAIPALANIPSS